MKNLLLIPLIILFFACASLNDPYAEIDSSGNFIYPHPENISQGAVHSQIAYSNEMAGCFACHRDNSSYGGPRSCYDCHTESFGHSSTTFSDPSEHGPVAIQAGAMNMCNACHGSSLTGDKGPSCYLSGCHEGSPYPHNISNYGSKEVHKSLTRDSDFPVCLNCHEKDRASQKGIVACADCHHNSDRNCLSCHPNPEDD